MYLFHHFSTYYFPPFPVNLVLSARSNPVIWRSFCAFLYIHAYSAELMCGVHPWSSWFSHSCQLHLVSHPSWCIEIAHTHDKQNRACGVPPVSTCPLRYRIDEYGLWFLLVLSVYPSPNISWDSDLYLLLRWVAISNIISGLTSIIIFGRCFLLWPLGIVISLTVLVPFWWCFFVLQYKSRLSS